MLEIIHADKLIPESTMFTKTDVGVVLIAGIKPTSAMDWTMGDLSEDNLLDDIVRFYVAAAKPLIDDVFYGKILRGRIESVEKRKIDNIKAHFEKYDSIIGEHSKDMKYFEEIRNTFFSNNDTQLKSIRLRQIKALINTIHKSYNELKN